MSRLDNVDLFLLFAGELALQLINVCNLLRISLFERKRE